MNVQDVSLASSLSSLIQLRQGGTTSGKALHKPILILALLEEMETAEEEPFISIDERLKHRFESIWTLLLPQTAPGDFFMPVWHLPNDGFWEVFTSSNLVPEKQYHSLKGVAEAGLMSRFSAPLAGLLATEEGRELARMVILDQYFPQTKQYYFQAYGQAESILKAEAEMVLQEMEPRYRRSVKIVFSEGFIRDWKFRHQILNLYDHTCCISGLQVQVLAGRPDPLLDACHIQTHALSGINSPSNGIALCKNLHAAFDNGLISLADDFSVLVSRQVRENKTAYSLLPLAGTKIHLPTQERFQPARDHLEWHRTQWGF